MPLKPRQLKEDLLCLKWQLIFLVLITGAVISSYVAAFYFRNDMQRLEVNALSAFDLVSGQVREVERSEQAIIDNIDRFNSMAANTIMDEENRVVLLEEIRTIRERHRLFPVSVEIREQDRYLLPYPAGVENPDEQISLRSSLIRIQLPLLHEQDLTRFLADFMGSGRLVVGDRCTIEGRALPEDDLLEIVEHQLATCNFYWYTLRREPFTGI